MRSLGRKPSRPELLQLTGVDSEGEPLELDLHSFARIMVFNPLSAENAPF